jgi:hypothetical protein
MSGADKVIRWSTAAAVIGVAAVVSYQHAYALVHAHGETDWTARLIPLTVDGLIWASSMVMLGSARRSVRVSALMRWLLAIGCMLARPGTPKWCRVAPPIRGSSVRMPPSSCAQAHLACLWRRSRCSAGILERPLVNLYFRFRRCSRQRCGNKGRVDAGKYSGRGKSLAKRFTTVFPA